MTDKRHRIEIGDAEVGDEINVLARVIARDEEHGLAQLRFPDGTEVWVPTDAPFVVEVSEETQVHKPPDDPSSN